MRERERDEENTMGRIDIGAWSYYSLFTEEVAMFIKEKKRRDLC